jgi:epoxide hydrolase-like predicted phosphatase
MEPKAVVFDLDGVYFERGTEEFISKLQERHGLSEEDIKGVYLKSEQMKDYKTGRIGKEQFWSYAIRTWGIDATTDEILALLAESYAENPEIVQLISDLKTQGVKTAVCTNNFPERIAALDERFHFKENFDVFVTSYEEGIMKPDARIFEILAARLGLRPDEIMMSDDKPENVVALQKLGFQAFVYAGLDDFRRKVNA